MKQVTIFLLDSSRCNMVFTSPESSGPGMSHYYVKDKDIEYYIPFTSISYIKEEEIVNPIGGETDAL
jgi:hypothetical protein